MFQRTRYMRPSPSVPVRFRFHDVKKEIIGKSSKIIIVPEAGHTSAPRENKNNHANFLIKLKEQISSPEFWLGILTGIMTRVTIRLAIEASFSPASKADLRSTLVSVIACASAGVAAGMITYLARALYRNAKIAEKNKKEKYGNANLVRSALAGLIGGAFGACVIVLGGLIARASMLAVGVTAGALLGLPYALAVSPKQSNSRQAATGRGKWAFQCATFGAAGGVLGVISADLLSAHNAIVASVSEASIPLNIASSAAPLPDACAAGSCAAPAPSAPPVIQAKAPVHHTAFRPHRANGQVHLANNKPLLAQHTDKAPPIARIREVVHLAYVRWGNVAGMRSTPHDPPGVTASTQLDIKGPCADPRIACAERVFFDSNGDATKVVLDVQPEGSPAPHFEVQPSAATASNWNGAARGLTAATASTADASKVSLVVPFVNRLAPSPIGAAQSSG
jgi:hypothetical protein